MLFDLLFSSPVIALAWIVAMVVSISFHEFSHALMAFWLGDTTARDLGRLTINPLKHLDLIGTILLIFAGFGWGKPVPFNPYNLRNQRFGPALVSLAGPLSNVVLAFIFGVILKLVAVYGTLPFENGLVQLLNAMIIINVVLAAFNLIPIPPLDGSKILYAFLPARSLGTAVALERWGAYLLIFLLIFAGSVFGAFFNVVVAWVYSLIF
jgi:Zn-dependent protease